MKVLIITTFLIAIGCLLVASEPPCPKYKSIPLENYTKLDDGRLMHNEVTYPSNLYWKEDDGVIYGCIYNIIERSIKRCCPEGQVMNKTNMCVDAKDINGSNSLLILPKKQLAPELQTISDLKQVFHVIVDGRKLRSNYLRYFLNPSKGDDELFVLQQDGSIVIENYDMHDSWDYCLIWTEWQNATSAFIYFIPKMDIETALHLTSFIISIIFLVITFVIYAILEELRNMPGKIMMSYISGLIVGYSGLFVINYDVSILPHSVCILTAFVIHFSFLASFFWLNVMCFDIWWTFGGFRSLQGSVKQREKKKFIMYSIYAWGCASVLTAICIIMDLAPGIPKSFIRPEFGMNSCWFTTDEAKGIYFYGPMGVTVICNICLFISTALKIAQHKKDTAHHLKGSESRRHDDNKQWFNLYLKLFIVMGINWSMEIVSWLFESSPAYIWYITDLTNTLQGVIIFIIFVWKDKIKRLLLKRLGCQDRNFMSRNSTRSAYHSSASRTCTTSIPIQEKTNPIVDPSCRSSRITIEESVCN